MKTLKQFYFLSHFFLIPIIFSCCNDDDPQEEIQVISPTANFAFNLEVANVGESVMFTDTSIPGTGTIDSWNWTFTGGTPSTSNEQNPTVIFNSKGEFSVSLIITANDGATSNTSQNILAVEGCPIYDCEKFLVDVEMDIVYGISNNLHLMNIYKPKGDLRSTKPAILINGGGQYEGSDLSVLDLLAKRLASYGFVVATARYRNGVQNGTANLLRGMVDSKAAVRFLRANASSYGIDPKQIFAGGWASGAYNALVHTYWQEEDVPTPILDGVINAGMITNWEGVQGNPEISSDVLGVVNLGGSIFGTEEAFGDDLYITANDLPMFAVHGELDNETPCNALELETGNWEFGSCVIHSRLQSLGILSELTVIANGAHEAPRLSENIDNYLPSLVDFLFNNL